MWGVRGRALSHPRLPALWAGCRGPLPTGCGCGGLRAWGPVANPTTRAVASWLCALWGRHEGARGGDSCLGVGRPGSGALPAPTARPLGGLPGPTTHWQWVWGGAGVGTRHHHHSARSCVLWGRHEGAWGGHLLPRCGTSGVGRSPTPDCPPSGQAAGAHYPLAVGEETSFLYVDCTKMYKDDRFFGSVYHKLRRDKPHDSEKMADFKIQGDKSFWQGRTCVPDCVIDKYVKYCHRNETSHGHSRVLEQEL